MSLEAGQYFVINTKSATPVVLSTTSCTLGNVSIDTAGKTGNTLTIYDGVDTTGTIVAVIDATQVTAGSRFFAHILKSGCCVVCNTGTAGSSTISIH